MNTVISICSGNALNEYLYLQENDYPKDISLIFYDIIYEKDIHIKELIRYTFSQGYTGDIIFCSNIHQVYQHLFNRNIILLIGFNITESISIPRELETNIQQILDHIDYVKTYQSLKLLCRNIYRYCKNTRVHIQMKEIVVYTCLDDFYKSFD